MQRVGNPKRWECGERGAKRHLEERQGFLSLAFFEIAQHPGERLSIDEFLALWIESHGDRRSQAFAELREFGLIGAVAARPTRESNLMTDEPVFE